MMVIKSFIIENFKGIRKPVKIEFKPLTLLFGPNSAGKSSIVHAIHYAREVFSRRNLDPDFTLKGGSSLNLGGFKNFVFGHDISLPVTFLFNLDLRMVDLSEYLIQILEPDDDEFVTKWRDRINERVSNVQSAWVKMVIRWDKYDEKVLCTLYEIGFDEKIIARIQLSSDSIPEPELRLFDHPLLPEEFVQDFDYIEDEYIGMDDESEYFYAADDEAKGLFESRDRQKKSFDSIDSRKSDKLRYYYSDLGITFALKEKFVLPDFDRALKIQEPFFLNWQDEAIFYHGLFDVLIQGPGRLLRDTLDSLFYLGPLRKIPQRNHAESLSPNESLWSNGIAAWDVLYRCDNKFLERVNKWLIDEDRLNSSYEIVRKKYKELDTDGMMWIRFMSKSIIDAENDIREELISLPEKTRLHLREWGRDIEVMPQDIGIGLSQMLPVVILPLYAERGFVAIEQPELHIHPALQVALGDLFICQIQEKEVCFLIETHSEHLLLRLLKRIRETNDDEIPPGKWPLKPEQLAVYYVEQGDEGVALTKIRVDEDGEFIDRWPKGFFSERAGELF